uniref:U6 snRNA-associated Sm-like protein LSm4 n=2 Tax=Ascaris suum TaxID=6253 RepID=F1LDH0_ASCSU
MIWWWFNYPSLSQPFACRCNSRWRWLSISTYCGQKIMVLPLSLLRTAQNHPMLVELKNGETYNGHLVSCDAWMNIHLRDAICTSRDGDRFLKMPEVYVRGSTIKYLRIPDDVVELVKDEVKEVRRQQKDQQRAKRAMQGGSRGGGQGGRGALRSGRGGQQGRGRGK